VRRSSNNPFVRLRHSMDRNLLRVIYGDMRDAAALRRAIDSSKPDEVYNLAAQSDVGISFMCPEEAAEINYYGLGRLVHAVLDSGLQPKIYQASTSEMFGSSKPPQNEKTPFKPVSPYGIAKLRAYEDFVVGYRKKYSKLFICSGFLFNHESPRRGEHFVTRKITISLAKIKLGLQESFSLGNLDALRDWGYAPDYVQAMWMMLQQKTPKDYVIGTGKQHSVRHFVEAAASALNMQVEWKGKGLKEVGMVGDKVVLTINKKFYRPVEVNSLCGDPSKARREISWKPSLTFPELVELMAKSDLVQLQREQKMFS